MTLKVKVDRLLCIGTADCVALAPNTFELDSEAKAIVKKARQGDSDEQILEAAKTCPVLAIIVENEKGEQVFP